MRRGNTDFPTHQRYTPLDSFERIIIIGSAHTSRRSRTHVSRGILKNRHRVDPYVCEAPGRADILRTSTRGRESERLVCDPNLKLGSDLTIVSGSDDNPAYA